MSEADDLQLSAEDPEREMDLNTPTALEDRQARAAAKVLLETCRLSGAEIETVCEVTERGLHSYGLARRLQRIAHNHGVTGFPFVKTT